MRRCVECGRQFDTGVTLCPDDGTPTVAMPSDEDLVGTSIDGRFTVRSLLGAGGMGTVYRAHQHSMDRDVALKVLKRCLIEDDQAIKRFLREARAASRLTNPHTITVFDFGQTESGLLYIVMELLRGEPLSRFQTGHPGPMEPRRAILLVLQVLDALVEAHGAGVLHRDLKPDNIFLLETDGSDDFVKVLDFGIAKVLGVPGTQLTETGKVFGTPAYMSPEQAQGEELDARSDLYTAGLILFELVAGQLPFQSNTPMGYLLKKVNERPPTVSQVNPAVSLPPGLEELLDRLLAVKPADRPASARDVRDRLRALLDAPAPTRGAASEAPPGPAALVPVPESVSAPVPKSDPTTPWNLDLDARKAGPSVQTRSTLKTAGPPRTAPWTWILAGVAAAGLAGGLFWILGPGTGANPTDEPVESGPGVPAVPDVRPLSRSSPDLPETKDTTTSAPVLPDTGPVRIPPKLAEPLPAPAPVPEPAKAAVRKPKGTALDDDILKALRKRTP